MWKKIATCICKVASDVCGVTKGSEDEAKDILCWNEEVQRTIKEKKECYKHMYHDRSMDNIEKYKVAKKTIKQVVSVANCRMYEGEDI
jgi:ferredoxin-thioredoxin reductase catalytic subunit